MAAAGFFHKLRQGGRRIGVALVLVVMITAGYLTMSAATSCPAKAQACACGICVVVGPTSASGLFANVAAQAATQITAATGIITANYLLAAQAFSLQAVARFGQIVLDVDDWFDTFWFYNQRPGMQAQTEQQNVMDTMQAVTLASFRDVAETARTQNLLGEVEIRSLRELSPSAPVCAAGTIASGMARAASLSRAYARAAPIERSRRGAGERSTGGNDIRARIQNIRARYCDTRDNNGASGCAADGPMVNADIDVTGTVFARDTIDLTDADTRQAVDDLIDNIAEPFVTANIAPSAVNSASGMQYMLARDGHRAQRQTIHTALQYIVARRAPGGIDGRYLAEIRQAAGISPDMLSANPSQNEIMEVMMNERFRTGQISVEQIDMPENNAREQAVQNAFQLMQLDAQLELMDRYALMLAAQAGLEARELRPASSRGGQ